VELLSLALPEEERETFGYDAASVDWWDYWINVHIPAQRKWSYPLIEGRPLEPRPLREFRWAEAASGNGHTPPEQNPQSESPIPTWRS
jgi:hypothetical protein